MFLHLQRSKTILFVLNNFKDSCKRKQFSKEEGWWQLASQFIAPEGIQKWRIPMKYDALAGSFL